jgi:hypothetical protein
MKRFSVLLTLLFVGGCAVPPAAEEQAGGDTAVVRDADKLIPFSSGTRGELPSGWEPMVIFKQKKRTEYGLVEDQNDIVLRSYAVNSSSGLMQYVDIDPTLRPWIQWRWKIGNLSDAVSKAEDLMEDAPARIILGFDGDKGVLPFVDQISFETAKVFTGYDFPYATLMYVWDSKAPIGTVRKSKRSGRIRTLVVERGTADVGKWQNFTRNIVEDFEKAYGEKPGRLIGIGVLTDTDYSGETVETLYGDIRFTTEKK